MILDKFFWKYDKLNIHFIKPNMFLLSKTINLIKELHVYTITWTLWVKTLKSTSAYDKSWSSLGNQRYKLNNIWTVPRNTWRCVHNRVKRFYFFSWIVLILTCTKKPFKNHLQLKIAYIDIIFYQDLTKTILILI